MKINSQESSPKRKRIQYRKKTLAHGLNAKINEKRIAYTVR